MGTKEIKKDIEELKASLNLMGDELATINKQQRTIINLMSEIKDLKMVNEDQQNKINSLETRVSDLEQYTRRNDVIITGLVIKPRSYAWALNGDASVADSAGHDDSAEAQVTAFLHDKQIAIDRRNIEACHIIPSKNLKDKHVVIARFANRKYKIDLLRQGRRLKGTNVYINEHLTKKNADIARQARVMKKQGKIQATWTSNCKVFVKLNGIPEQAKVLCIWSIDQLEKLGSS